MTTEITTTQLVDALKATTMLDESGHLKGCGYDLSETCACIQLPALLRAALPHMTPEPSGCAHTYPDGTSCTLTVEQHASVAGLGMAHGAAVAEAERETIVQFLHPRLTYPIEYLRLVVDELLVTGFALTPTAAAAQTKQALVRYADRERPVIRIEGVGEAEEIIGAFKPAICCTVCYEVLTPDEETTPTEGTTWAHRDCLEAGE